ncbi:hypothetical protein Pcinc_012912 [Petrolisthes cinctipes]|uniref:Uncharacterized protein n=1 Tax=Petrolisthes cinctipes TaxID=88211 RepID=A0AAE1FY16_PETCI|nr:hypothetical protein Pcinc_012912 [Petrolisthes cinctipes]
MLLWLRGSFFEYLKNEGIKAYSKNTGKRKVRVAAEETSNKIGDCLHAGWITFIQAILEHRLKNQSEYPSDIMLTEVSSTSKPLDQFVKCECTEVMLQVWMVMGLSISVNVNSSSGVDSCVDDLPSVWCWGPIGSDGHWLCGDGAQWCG